MPKNKLRTLASTIIAISVIGLGEPLYGSTEHDLNTRYLSARVLVASDNSADRTTGANQLLELANLGHARAQFSYAICCADARFEIDNGEKEAFWWMLEAYGAGLPEAKIARGLAHLQGAICFNRNWQDAARYLSDYDVKNHPYALFGQGYVALGSGFEILEDEKNGLASGREFFERSARAGCDEAENISNSLDSRLGRIKVYVSIYPTFTYLIVWLGMMACSPNDPDRHIESHLAYLRYLRGVRRAKSLFDFWFPAIAGVSSFTGMVFFFMSIFYDWHPIEYSVPWIDLARELDATLGTF